MLAKRYSLVTIQDSTLLDCSLPTAVREESGEGAGCAACGGTARTLSRPGGAVIGGTARTLQE